MRKHRGQQQSPAMFWAGRRKEKWKKKKFVFIPLTVKSTLWELKGIKRRHLKQGKCLTAPLCSMQENQNLVILNDFWTQPYEVSPVMWGQRKGMCWAQAKYFHMGVEFTGSRWHVGSYVTWGSSRDLLPPYGVCCAVSHSRGTFTLQVSCFGTSLASALKLSHPIVRHSNRALVCSSLKAFNTWHFLCSDFISKTEKWKAAVTLCKECLFCQNDDNSRNVFHVFSFANSPLLDTKLDIFLCSPCMGSSTREIKAVANFNTEIKYSAILWPFISLLHCNCLFSLFALLC